MLNTLTITYECFFHTGMYGTDTLGFIDLVEKTLTIKHMVNYTFQYILYLTPI